MNPRVALRVAIKAALDADPYVGATVTYRPTRQPIRLPAVTFYDYSSRADSVVPLFDRTVIVDVWTRSGLDDAEAIAHAVNGHLDNQGFQLRDLDDPYSDVTGLVAYLSLRSDVDDPQEDADLTRKRLTYRALVYEYDGPEPFGG